MLGLLFLLILLPIVLIIIGIIIQTSADDELRRKKGKQVLLTGIIVLGLEILIGYSICSNMKGFH